MPVDVEAELNRLGEMWSESVESVDVAEVLARATATSEEDASIDDLAPPQGAVHRSSRLFLVAAVVAIIAAVTAAALTWGTKSTPPSSPIETTIAADSSYRVLVARPTDGGDGASGLEIVEVVPGPSERVLRRLVPPQAGSRFLPETGRVSSSGWFAIEMAADRSGWVAGQPSPPYFYVMFVDLRDPAKEPRSVPGSFVADGRWDLAGDRYAISTDLGSAILIDPKTGDFEVTRSGPPDAPRIWSDRNRSISVWRTSMSSPRQFPFMNPWGMSDVDLVPPLFRALGPRLVSDDGRVICRLPLPCAYGPHSERVYVWTATYPAPADHRMEETTWYDGDLLPASLAGATFSAVDESIWELLTTTLEGRPGLMLARTSAPGLTEVVVPFVGYDDTTSSLAPEIVGIATDDSLIVVRVGDDVIGIPTDGEAAFSLPTRSLFVGLLSSSIADRLPDAPSA